MRAWKVLLPAIAVAALGTPAAASARDAGVPVDGLGTTAETVLSCTDPLLETPFTAFGDDLNYVLAPNGSFESTDGWQLDGGAAAVTGDDPFDLQSGTDETMLSMPEGSSATSPLMCVDPSYPTFRFPTQAFGHRGTIRVEVSYPYSRWGARFRRSDSFRLDDDAGWGLSPELDLDPERGGDGPGWRPMAIRLIARDGAAGSGFELDDVYVDPRARW